MTPHSIHSPHPDTHSHGLCDGCPRCEEHAEHPVDTLDTENLARIVRLATNPDRFARAQSRLELVAAARVLSLREKVGHLYRVEPAAVREFLGRYRVALPFPLIGRELIDRARDESAEIDEPVDALLDAGIVPAELVAEARFCADTYEAGQLDPREAAIAAFCAAFELGVRCAVLRAG